VISRCAVRRGQEFRRALHEIDTKLAALGEAGAIPGALQDPAQLPEAPPTHATDLGFGGGLHPIPAAEKAAPQNRRGGAEDGSDGAGDGAPPQQTVQCVEPSHGESRAGASAGAGDGALAMLLASPPPLPTLLPTTHPTVLSLRGKREATREEIYRWWALLLEQRGHPACLPGDRARVEQAVLDPFFADLHAALAARPHGAPPRLGPANVSAHGVRISLGPAAGSTATPRVEMAPRASLASLGVMVARSLQDAFGAFFPPTFVLRGAPHLAERNRQEEFIDGIAQAFFLHTVPTMKRCVFYFSAPGVVSLSRFCRHPLAFGRMLSQ